MYPVAFSSRYEPERSRLTTFFRYFMAIPALFVFGLYAFVGFFTIIAAWVMVSLTGSYPPGLYSFNARLLRHQARVNAYMYLLTDAYPPFNGTPDDGYPVQVGVGAAKPEYSRAKAFFRLIVGIPVMVLGWLYSGLVGATVVLSWFVIVFTGRQPAGFQGLTESSLNYLTRGSAYFLLLTEDYPPIELDAQPGLEASAAQALPS